MEHRKKFNHTEETKQKIRAANLGRKHTPEAREKIRQASLEQWAERRQRNIQLPLSFSEDAQFVM